MSEIDSKENLNDQQKQANGCIALGVGVGALGTGAAVISGAVCPICVVAAPALVGVGVWTRLKGSKANKSDPVT